MKSTNITIKVESTLAHKVKVLAARRGTSLSRLVAEQLEQMVRGDQAYEAARQSATRHLNLGLDLGWSKPATRDELHER